MDIRMDGKVDEHWDWLYHGLRACDA